MKKINGKVILIVVIWLLVISLLLYSRFTNLGWGLPYPMHPDERNIANSLQQLQCRVLADCFNPHFFAYGQFPLYLGYLLVWAGKGFRDFGKIVINFEEAVMSLRAISAIASIINVFVLVKIIELISNINPPAGGQKSKTNSKFKTLNFTLNFALCILIFTLSPYAIQFSHFGTTESLLMLFYSLIIYLSMRLLERRTTYAVVWLALVSGLAIATKVSSVIFLVVPVIVLMSKINPPAGGQRSNLSSKLKVLNFTFGFILCTLIFALIFSPHNLINFYDFFNSIKYEADVATGKAVVFYTRQFISTVPVWFQSTKVFPYVLGWPVFILGSLGILGGLGFKDRKINLLRFAILVYLIPSAFLYAKWTRFMAPILPIIIVFTIVFIQNIIIRLNRRFWIPAFAGMTMLLIYPGINYLRVYQNPDIRFQATDWINKNIPENSFVISETGNVVDIPLAYKKNINVISFNFYDLDESPQLQSELKEHLEKADYIFIPSRRIFANHAQEKYKKLNQYYVDLIDGKLGFKKIAEFSSGLNDEHAEETWTVFDHPVIRIYKRID